MYLYELLVHSQEQPLPVFTCRFDGRGYNCWRAPPRWSTSHTTFLCIRFCPITPPFRLACFRRVMDAHGSSSAAASAAPTRSSSLQSSLDQLPHADAAAAQPAFDGAAVVARLGALNNRLCEDTDKAVVVENNLARLLQIRSEIAHSCPPAPTLGRPILAAAAPPFSILDARHLLSRSALATAGAPTAG